MRIDLLMNLVMKSAKSSVLAIESFHFDFDFDVARASEPFETESLIGAFCPRSGVTKAISLYCRQSS